MPESCDSGRQRSHRPADEMSWPVHLTGRRRCSWLCRTCLVQESVIDSGPAMQSGPFLVGAGANSVGWWSVLQIAPALQSTPRGQVKEQVAFALCKVRITSGDQRADVAVLVVVRRSSKSGRTGSTKAAPTSSISLQRNPRQQHLHPNLTGRFQPMSQHSWYISLGPCR